MAPPNQFPKLLGTSIHRIDTIPKEELTMEKSDSSINMIDLNQFSILASLDPNEMDVSLDF